MKWLFKFLLSGVSVLLAAYLLPGVHVDDYGTALLVAALISIVNIFVRPVLIVLTIPITFLTLGLFLLVINAGMVLLVASLVDGFHVDGFLWALGCSLLLSLLNSFFSDMLKDE